MSKCFGLSNAKTSRGMKNAANIQLQSSSPTWKQAKMKQAHSFKKPNSYLRTETLPKNDDQKQKNQNAAV
jgi:hypothetical protein